MKIFSSTREIRGSVGFSVEGYEISVSNVFSPTEARIFHGREDVTLRQLELLRAAHPLDESFSSQQIPSGNLNGLLLCHRALTDPKLMRVMQVVLENGSSFVEALCIVNHEIAEFTK